MELVVSLGTGQLTLRPLKQQSVMAWVRTLVELAMSSHVPHKVAASILGNKYIRLDPDSGEGAQSWLAAGCLVGSFVWPGGLKCEGRWV